MIMLNIENQKLIESLHCTSTYERAKRNKMALDVVESQRKIYTRLMNDKSVCESHATLVDKFNEEVSSQLSNVKIQYRRGQRLLHL